MRLLKVLLAVTVGISTFTTEAQYGKPDQPQLAPSNLKAQLNRSAYALFLSEACSVSTQILVLTKKLIQQVEESDSRQTELLTEFRKLKSRHSDNSNSLGIAKRCYLDSAKTRSFVSDVSSELEEMANEVAQKRAAYVLAVSNWERAQREIAERREREQKEAKERVDRDTRERHQSNLESNVPILGRFIVSNKYGGGNNIGVVLKDWSYSESEKTATAKIEIRWYGKFTGKSYGADGTIRMIYDEGKFGSNNYELGRNLFWNPTWLSSTLEAYLRCAKTLFGSCD